MFRRTSNGFTTFWYLRRYTTSNCVSIITDVKGDFGSSFNPFNNFNRLQLFRKPLSNHFILTVVENFRCHRVGIPLRSFSPRPTDSRVRPTISPWDRPLLSGSSDTRRGTLLYRLHPRRVQSKLTVLLDRHNLLFPSSSHDSSI